MTDNQFAGFNDDGFEVLQEGFPGMGYSGKTKMFYVGDKELSKVTVRPLDYRQCKEVRGNNGMTRYSIFTKKQFMEVGDVTYRTQILVEVDGEVYAFGTKGSSVSKAWLNPGEDEDYHDPKFDLGIWKQVEAVVKRNKKEYGVNTLPYCYDVTLEGSSKEITMKSATGQSSKVYPIVRTGEIEFVGADEAYRLKALVEELDVKGWVAEWQGDEPTQEVEVYNNEETEPTMTETAPSYDEEDQIPF